MAEHTQRRRSHQRAGHAMSRAITHHQPRRPAARAIGLLIVLEIVQITLNLFWRGEAAEYRALARSEIIQGHWQQRSVSGLTNARPGRYRRTRRRISRTADPSSAAHKFAGSGTGSIWKSNP